ncbi:MAG: hypothetical protein ACJATO_002623 [Arenicella sp.]|jgi:hypothetical protein
MLIIKLRPNACEAALAAKTDKGLINNPYQFVPRLADFHY